MATELETAAGLTSGEGQGLRGGESMTPTVGGTAAASAWPEPLGRFEIALVFGLPLFLALTGVLTWWSVQRIEAKVERELVADLAGAGIETDQLAIETRYRDAAISGELQIGDDPAAIDAAVDDSVGRGLLRGLDTAGLRAAPPDPVPPDPELRDLATGPVRINVAYDGLRLRVSGTVLNEGQHNVVLETLDLLTGRAEIDEQLTISRLAPAVDGADERISDLILAVESMDLAEEWTIRLTDRGLAIEAIVSDPEAAAAVGALDGLLTSTPTTVQVTDPTAIEEAA